MQKQEKQRVVAELTERLKATQTLIVTDYRGLSVTEIDDLRTKLLEHGARYSVVKNTLTRLAAEQAGTKELLELIDGPTAIAFLDAEADPVAAAKVLSDAASQGRILVVRGGLLDGVPVTEEQVKSLASLPPAEILHGQLVSALAGPLTMVVGLFTAPLRDFVNVIDARIKQLGADADAPAPSENVEEATTPAEEQTPEEETHDASPQPEAADKEE
jgi:large subunit ribosomal protein L10